MLLRRPLAAIPLLVLVLLGCGTAESAVGGGTVIIASAADAEAMLPPLRTTITGRMVSELLFDPLVEIGPALNVFGDAGFAPRLARRWE